jgi:hypothetical protein
MHSGKHVVQVTSKASEEASSTSKHAVHVLTFIDWLT